VGEEGKGKRERERVGLVILFCAMLSVFIPENWLARLAISAMIEGELAAPFLREQVRGESCCIGESIVVYR
jgi:hypothetical protein